MKQLTLVIVTQNNRVLLGMKKRGFGAGRYNGFGGKVELGESIEAAASRELHEEVGLIASHLMSVGQLQFAFADDAPDLLVHLFVVTAYTGEVIESEEMKPEWFGFDDVPYDEMWPDDRYWLPAILDGNVCKGRFVFDKPSTKEYTSQILESEILIRATLSELDSVR